MWAYRDERGCYAIHTYQGRHGADIEPAAMPLSAAACGTTDDSDASGKASGSSSIEGYDVSSVAKDESIAKLLPESVTKDGKFTVGMDLSYPPAEFLAADGKTPSDRVDLVKAMAKEFGLTAYRTRISIPSSRLSVPNTISASRPSPSRRSV